MKVTEEEEHEPRESRTVVQGIISGETLPPTGLIQVMVIPPELQAVIAAEAKVAGVDRQTYVERLLAERLLNKTNPAVPPAPDLFQGKDITPIPNNPYSHFVVEAIAKGGPLARYITDGWRENTIDGQPLLLKQAAPWRGGSMVAKFDPVEQQAVNAAELWARVEGLNPLTADVALAILGTLGDPRQGEKPKFPMLEPVVVTTDRILQYKGIQKWGSDRRVLQQRIAAEFKTLQDLTVEIRSIPFGKDKKGKELLVSIPRCKLFDVAEVY